MLAALVHDPSRHVRRALAGNSASGPWHDQLAADPAPEVRARARSRASRERQTPNPGSAEFEAATQTLRNGGVLSADVAAVLGQAKQLDEEAALWAARVLPRSRLIELVRTSTTDDVGHPDDEAPDNGKAPGPGRRRALSLATGVSLRHRNVDLDDAGHRELVAEVSQTLSTTAARYGVLSGKSRLAAWLADGLAHTAEHDLRLLPPLGTDTLADEHLVLCRAAGMAPALSPHVLASCQQAGRLPFAALALAWADPTVTDESVEAMAKLLVRHRPRGRDLPEDELDLDPKRRCFEVLERVVLSANRKVTLSPRTALTVAALDSRRVRYVLAALPQWRTRLSGTMLGRVLRQNAGALSAARSEQRSRVAEARPWTDRVMSDIEIAVALGVGHYTATALERRISSGRQQLKDGSAIACGLEVRAALEGTAAISPMVKWATTNRATDPVALSLWLLLEEADRRRSSGMIASALDSLATQQHQLQEKVAEALAAIEHRSPGRLEQVNVRTPGGRAALASGLARAYRAVGGLRDER